ncbi:hypothetical protein ACMFMG_007857 [Clarireedia jacksonii]
MPPTKIISATAWIMLSTVIVILVATQGKAMGSMIMNIVLNLLDAHLETRAATEAVKDSGDIAKGLFSDAHPERRAAAEAAKLPGALAKDLF